MAKTESPTHSLFDMKSLNDLNIQLYADGADKAGILELYARGRLPKGFVKQESVPWRDFLATRWGGRGFGSR